MSSFFLRLIATKHSATAAANSAELIRTLAPVLGLLVFVVVDVVEVLLLLLVRHEAFAAVQVEW